MLVPVCVVLCVSWSCGARSHWNVCMMLHGLCVGEEAGARNLVFFRIKWLEPAMKATSSVRRLRLGSFDSFYVFCNNACSCVRSSMRLLELWCQIALEWLHDVAWALCWGGSRSTKPSIFPCKVVADVAWCCGCLRSTIVFCSWRLRIVLAWLHPGCDCDLSADFRTFGTINFPFKNPFKKCFKIVFFLLWRRDPVLELLLPTLLCVILLCFATQSLQIAL